MSLDAIYEHALDELRELLEHNLDLNFGHDLSIDAASFISIPDPNAPGASLTANTKNSIILEVYENQFAESRDANTITPLHKSMIKLQQDVAIYLLEVEIFMRDLKLFPYKQYLPATIQRVIANAQSMSANADIVSVISEESFMSFMMAKLIGSTELEMLRRIGNIRLLSKFRLSASAFADNAKLAIERHELEQLLSTDAKQINYHKLAQYFSYQ